MAIGDPHIQSLDYPGEYQTCNALEFFGLDTKQEEEARNGTLDRDIKNGTRSAADTVLLSNDHTIVTGTLARWSSGIEGTYFEKVIVQLSPIPTSFELLFIAPHTMQMGIYISLYLLKLRWASCSQPRLQY